MREQQIEIETAAGTMPAFVAHPDEGGPFPPVIMLMDGPGISPVLHDLARLLACSGYYVMLPDLYHRGPKLPMFGEDGDFIMPNLKTMSETLNQECVAEDVQACLDFAGSSAMADRRLAGLIGFCMGARFALIAADALGDEVVAISAIHPGRLVSSSVDSPHRRVSGITAALYLGIAEHDPFLSEGAVEEMRRVLTEQEKDFQLEVLAGSHHGFAFPGREHFDKTSALLALERSLSLFRRTLLAPLGR